MQYNIVQTASDAQPKQESSGPTKKRVDTAYSEAQFLVGSYVAADVGALVRLFKEQEMVKYLHPVGGTLNLFN